MMDKRKICVVGTGHIGLPLAAVLAEAGFDVTGYDTNDDFVSRVNTTGAAGFLEEGLDELLAKHLHKRLTLTSTPPAGQDVYIITVGTPLEAGTHRPDLDRIRIAVQRIAAGFGTDPLIILRSTVSIGTTRNIVLPELRQHAQRWPGFLPRADHRGQSIPGDAVHAPGDRRPRRRERGAGRGLVSPHHAQDRPRHISRGGRDDQAHQQHLP
jgi:hypothetical protein